MLGTFTILLLYLVAQINFIVLTNPIYQWQILLNEKYMKTEKQHKNKTSPEIWQDNNIARKKIWNEQINSNTVILRLPAPNLNYSIGLDIKQKCRYRRDLNYSWKGGPSSTLLSNRVSVIHFIFVTGDLVAGFLGASVTELSVLSTWPLHM